VAVAVLMHGCTTLEEVHQKATLAEKESQAVVTEQLNVATILSLIYKNYNFFDI